MICEMHTKKGGVSFKCNSLSFPFIQIQPWGTGEMAQQLRTLMTLAEDPGLIASNYMVAHHYL